MFLYNACMRKTAKRETSKRDYLQLRIPRAEKRGAALIEKLARISEVNGLSLNDVANMAVAAGLPMVETKLNELQELERLPA